MSRASRYSRIPVPIKAANDKETFGKQFMKQIKLPNIHNSSYSNVFTKISSQSRLDDFVNADYDSRNTDEGRPGSMSNPSTYSVNDVSIKRYHSTGQVYPRNFGTNSEILKESQITWPIMKEENFNEGYLKMQGIMNAKREDLMRKKRGLRKLGRQPLPPISKQYQDTYQHSQMNSNSDEWESSSDSSFGLDMQRNTGNNETSEIYMKNQRNYVPNLDMQDVDETNIESFTQKKEKFRMNRRIID